MLRPTIKMVTLIIKAVSRNYVRYIIMSDLQKITHGVNTWLTPCVILELKTQLVLLGF